MKAIFITVPLTLMVAPSFARPLKIPDAMLGSWCYAGDEGEFVQHGLRKFLGVRH
jgi:hypothetical protein